jgi:hypothetical protein
VALVLLAILVLLAVLIARVDAAPREWGELAPASTHDDAGDDEDLALAPTLESDVFALPVPDVDAGALARVAVKAPTSGAVVAAAYRAAGLTSDPTPGWRKRARLAGLVPTVAVRDGRDAAWRDVSDPTIDYVSVFSVGATWHLERLMFDPNELRISAIEAGRRRDRRRIAALAIRTYYAWLRLRAAGDRDFRWVTRAEEAAAELDALTDGWFSDAANRRMPQLPPVPSARNLPPSQSADQTIEE